MDKTTIIILVGYIVFFVIIFSLLFPKEKELINYNLKKFWRKFFKIFEPIVFELKRYLLY